LRELAAASYRHAVGLAQGQVRVQALGRLGLLLGHSKRWGEALEAFQTASFLAPQDPSSANNLAVVRHQLDATNQLVRAGQRERDAGRIPRAVSLFEEALGTYPWSSMAYNNLACTYGQVGLLDKGFAAFEIAIEIRPEYAKAYSNYGALLSEANQLEDASHAISSARMLQPSSSMHRANSAWVNMRLAAWKERKDDARRVREYIEAGRVERNERFPHQSSELAQCLGLSQSTVMAAAKRLAGDVFKITKGAREERGAVLRRLPLGRGGRLVVGYMSSDLFDHPVGRSVSLAVQFHLSKMGGPSVDPHCFRLGDPPKGASGKGGYDPVVHFFEHTSDVNVTYIDASLDPKAAAALVRDKGVHILLNLNGWTRSQRGDVFSLWPAPVSVSMIGFEMTMGASYVPYILGDRVALPPSVLLHAYTERAVYLPWSYLPNAHARWDSQPFTKEFPASILEVFEGYCTVSNFNRPQKVDPALLHTWANAVQRSPKARLTLAQAMYGVEVHYTRELAARGLPPGKHRFTVSVDPRGAYLKLLGRADLAVDTHFFGGATTTQDTLWEGTPTAMVPGENMVTRAGPSALEAVGIPSSRNEGFEELPEAIGIPRLPSGSLSVGSQKAYEDLIVRLIQEP